MRMSEWLLFNANSAIFSYIMATRSLSWIFIVLAHWNNERLTDMILPNEMSLKANVSSKEKKQSSKWKFEVIGPNQILEFIFYMVPYKNWKMYWSEQNFTGLGPEYQCSSWGLKK
jgi:hypothetical protein